MDFVNDCVREEMEALGEKVSLGLRGTGCPLYVHFLSPHGGVLWMPPWWEPRAINGSLFLRCSRFQYCFAPVYRASTYLVSAFHAHSTSCSKTNLQSTMVEYVLNSESEFLLVLENICFALIQNFTVDWA